MKALLILSLLVTGMARADFLDDHPALKKHVYQEPRSDLWVGFGVSPVGFLENRTLHVLSAFQFHWMPRYLDWEIINVSLGLTSFSKESYAKARTFFFRTSPKLRVLGFLSFGPMVGFEYVSFPDVGSIQVSPPPQFKTPNEPFSSKGIIYGAEISETIRLAQAYYLKISQVIYRQTYPTTTASNGWEYVFDKPELQADPARTAIKPSYVVLLEFSLLF